MRVRTESYIAIKTMNKQFVTFSENSGKDQFLQTAGGLRRQWNLLQDHGNL